MLKRVTASFICLVLSFGIVFPINAHAVTVINQDVLAAETALPIKSAMETNAEAAAVDTQLTATESSAVLSVDKKEGGYSLKVTAADETANPYAQYTLVSSDAFDIAGYSTIMLWVKPGAGAGWIEFSSNGAIIKSEENGDGRFEVGKDLESGKWTQITLNLLDAASITQGDDLVVKTDENSIWFYDGITSQKNAADSVDLSTMVNDSTQLSGGSLQFKKTAAGTAYNTNPTVLVSNTRVAYEKTLTTYADFKSGICSGGVSANSNGSVVFNTDYSDICTGGTAISGGSGSTPEYAFDNSTSSEFKSSQSGSNVNGKAYIGYTFSSATQINGFSIYQSTGPRAVGSVLLQYYNTSTSAWTTVGTYSLKETSGNKKDIFVCAPEASAASWRLLANDNTDGSQCWDVQEVEFYQPTTDYYTTAEFDISTAEDVEYGHVKYTATEDTELVIETMLSLDGGTTWGDWCELDEYGEIQGLNQTANLQNAKLKLRVSKGACRGSAIPVLHDIKIQLICEADPSAFIGGKLHGISIDTGNYDLSGETAANYDKATYTSIASATAIALSGDGKTLYYGNAGLYKLDLLSGESTLIYSSSGTTVISIKTNYDGSKACANSKHLYSNKYYYRLFKYDSTAATGVTLLQSERDTNYSAYDMYEDGSVAFVEILSSDKARLYYVPSNGASISKDFNSNDTNINISFSGDSNEFFLSYNNSSTGYINKYTYANGTLGSGSVISISNNTYGGITVSASGEEVYYLLDNRLYSYHLETRVTRKFDITATKIYKVIDDGKLLLGYVSQPPYKYFIYDPATDKEESVRPTEYTEASMIFDTDYSSNTVAYIPTADYLRVWYRNGATDLNKYLLSFDGKNSWYSHKNGSWEMVVQGPKPSLETLTKYGMTAAEVSAMTEEDYRPLYENGSEIYSVDVAAYFASVSPYITPAIKSIYIVTDEENITSDIGEYLYTAKKVDFTGSDWRKINSLYPIEIIPKEAKYLFFIYADNKYQYYDASGWQVETASEISTLISDTQANWENLSEIGMSAAEVRAIPADVLTSQLAGKDFSVVYCMRVADQSTVGYCCKISADYSKDFFAGTNLSLSINMIDGTTKTLTGLTDTEVEDFMVWLYGRQYGKGSIYYTIKTGATSYFVNYYTIQSVTVTEN